MEKKTIGAFIAVLRKAAGMTQRELAEQLNVSDKSISRWERDECAPDLSLIPVIAEIFDITTDELLRGERKASAANEAAPPEEDSKFIKEKSARRLRNLLRTQHMRLKERSLISLGVLFGGYLAAMICNFAFLRATLGFFLSLAFYAAAVILEICFLRRAALEEDDLLDHEAWVAYQNDLTRLGVKCFFLIWLMFGITCPLVLVGNAYYGLSFSSYFIYAVLFAAIFSLVFYLAHILAVKPTLAKKGLLILKDKVPEQIFRERKLLSKTLVIALTIGIALGAAAGILYETIPHLAAGYSLEFDDYESFKEFMETERAQTGEFLKPVEEEEEAYYADHTIKDKDGNVVCTYKWKNRTVTSVTTSFQISDDGLPMRVTTRETYEGVADFVRGICTLILVGIGVELCVCAIVYVLKLKKLKKSFENASSSKKT